MKVKRSLTEAHVQCNLYILRKTLKKLNKNKTELHYVEAETSRKSGKFSKNAPHVMSVVHHIKQANIPAV